jgi:hypothetical protein
MDQKNFTSSEALYHMVQGEAILKPLPSNKDFYDTSI